MITCVITCCKRCDQTNVSHEKGYDVAALVVVEVTGSCIAKQINLFQQKKKKKKNYKRRLHVA